MPLFAAATIGAIGADGAGINEEFKTDIDEEDDNKTMTATTLMTINCGDKQVPLQSWTQDATVLLRLKQFLSQKATPFEVCCFQYQRKTTWNEFQTTIFP